MDVRVGLWRKLSTKKIDAFELWFWRRFLRVPWTARRSNQSILKEISPGCSLEGLILKLKLQYFGCLMWRVDSLEKTLMLGGIGDRRGGEGDNRGWDGWMASLTRWTWVWVNSGSWWWTGRPGVLWFMGSQRVRHDWVTELNWNKVKHIFELFFFSLGPWNRKESYKICVYQKATHLLRTLLTASISITYLVLARKNTKNFSYTSCKNLAKYKI